MSPQLKALLLALCLMLAVVTVPVALAQEESTEESDVGGGEESSDIGAEESSNDVAVESSTDGSAASESDSASASAAAPAAEESTEEQTAERNVQEVPNLGGGKVTLVSNKNTLTHIASAPKVFNHYAIEEQERKSTEEANTKRKGEADQKKKVEEGEKAAKAKEQRMKQQLEEKAKKQKAEEAEKKLKEEKQKAEIELAKKRAEAKAKLEKSKEESAKKAAEAKSKEEKKKHSDKKTEQAAKRKAAEQKQKKRAAEQKKKRNSVRLVHGWRNYGSSYEFGHLYRWSNYCIVQGLVTGGHNLLAYLPRNCRPYNGRIMFALHRGRESRVDVLPDGRIYYVTGASSSWMSMNGMTFDTHRQHGWSAHYWSWRPYGHGWRYTTQSRYGSLCAVSGLIRHGHWGYFGRTMSSCWPRDGRLIFSGSNHHHITRIDQLTNGQFLRQGGYASHHWVSLDGMTYVAQHGGNHMNLYNGWHNYNHSYRQAKYMRTGPVCALSGLIRGHWNHYISRLPRGCRPRRRLIFGANVHNHNARVDILPDGRVLYINRRSGWNWLSLSGIHFIAYN